MMHALKGGFWKHKPGNVRNDQCVGSPLPKHQNKAKLMDKRGNLGAPLDNALEIKKNRKEDTSRVSSNWQISITTSVVLVFSISLTGCIEKPQQVIEHGGLDQCVSDPKSCNEEDLCRLAIFEEDNIKRWNDENLRWQPFVKEAQTRGLACGL